MKKNIIFLLLIFSFSAHAGLSSLLLGALLGSASKKGNPEKVSDLQKEIQQIKKNVPTLCNNISIRFQCWNQFTSPVKSVSVSIKNSDEILKYFQQNNYKVSLIEQMLVFDFMEEHLKFKEHQTVFISNESLILIFLFSLVPLFIGYVVIKNKQRVKQIKNLYENSDLFFWNSNDKVLLEQSLENNEIPISWSFNLSDEKILNISSFSNGRLSRVASEKQSLINAFRR
jgi:hypothetical protein